MTMGGRLLATRYLEAGEGSATLPRIQTRRNSSLKVVARAFARRLFPFQALPPLSARLPCSCSRDLALVTWLRDAFLSRRIVTNTWSQRGEIALRLVPQTSPSLPPQ